MDLSYQSFKPNSVSNFQIIFDMEYTVSFPHDNKVRDWLAGHIGWTMKRFLYTWTVTLIDQTTYQPTCIYKLTFWKREHWLAKIRVSLTVYKTWKDSRLHEHKWWQKASLQVSHLRQYTFRIFIAQCISITIPASPNLVPRLLEPTVRILGSTNT